MLKKITYLLILLLLLSSCIEIIDDVTLNSDGSGKFAYTINLSQSKLDVNSYLSLEYYDGKKVPSREELKLKIYEFRDQMNKQSGISNCKVTINETDFIIKLNCDFTSIEKLQDAIFVVLEAMSQKELTKQYWVTNSNDTITKKIPDFISGYKSYTDSDKDKLNSGVYISILRFDRLIKSSDNPSSVISKNQSAVLTRVNALELSQNPNLINNVVTLNK
jgi:hypothetical protein